MTYRPTIAVRTVKKKTGDGQRNCPKHVEFHSKNKFEKLVHLVGSITRKSWGCGEALLCELLQRQCYNYRTSGVQFVTVI